MKHTNVEGHTDLVRDSSTGAILNNDKSQYDQYLTLRAKRQQKTEEGKKMETSAQTTGKTTKKEVKPEGTKPAIAPGQMRVIKRNGSVVSYDAEKIAIAITKAFLAVEGGAAAASTRIHNEVNQLSLIHI